MKLKIENTTNYGKFKTVRGNRKLNKRYLTYLAESIKENNLLPFNPIIVNERMEVLDGQHRLAVAEMLGIDIYYVVSPTGSIADVQMLNTNVRGWKAEDFLDSYIERGFKDYEYLKEFSEKNDLSISISMHLLTGYKTLHKRSEVYTAFKNGEFKATHKEWADDFVKKLRNIDKFAKNGVYSDREFIYALVKVYSNGTTHEQLIELLKKGNVVIDRQATTRDYISLFENILSYKKRNLIHITN